MSSILDIEGTLQKGNNYAMEHWYWNEFLAAIDLLHNEENDFRYAYKDLDIKDLVNHGLVLPDTE